MAGTARLGCQRPGGLRVPEPRAPVRHRHGVRASWPSACPPRAADAAERLSAAQRALVEGWLERLGLLPLAEANPFSLSQGQKRRLSVAAMLIRGQSALILDEPTLGQDELQSDRLMAMMQELRSEGRAMAMITHDMRLVAEHADRLLVLGEGRVVFEGSPLEFFARPDEVEAAGLEMPSPGMVSAVLNEEHGSVNGLHTIAGFVAAAGPGPSRPSGPAPSGGVGHSPAEDGDELWNEV